MRWEGGEEIGRPFQDLLPELAIGLGISLAAFYITFEIMVNGLSGLIQLLTTEPIISFFLLSVVSLFFLIGYLLRIQIRHETEIRAISDYYERALDSTEQGLAIIDRDFRIKFQNRIALLSIGDATGGRCYEIYFERDKPCEDCRLEEVIRRRRCFRYLREHQDGRIFEVTLAPFEDKDGSTVVLETMKDVTEREYAEAKLREAALILKTMAEGVVITDAHGRIRDMNDRVLTLSGYSREELAGEKLESFFHEDDRKRLTALLDSVISGGKSESSELRMSCKDGRELTLSVNLSPLEGNSNPGSVIVTLHDITPLKMAEQELMEQVILADQLNTELAIQNEELMVAQEMLEASERRFRTLVEHAPDMIQLIDENGIILQVNPATVSCTGYSEEELLGQPLTVLLTDESKEIFYTEFLWLKEEGVHRAEIGFLSKGRRVIDLDCHCASTGDGSFVLIQRDISERKRMEEELERSRNELQRYLDHILTFNGMLDPDGTLKMANRTAVESTGLPYDEIIGKHFADIYWWSYDPMVQDRLRANIRRAASGETVVWEERVRVKDGFIITQLTLRPVFDENGENIRYIVAEGQDITRIKEAERKIRRAHDLINSISNFAGIADREGRLQLVNRRTLEALGFREEEVLGELFWECGWFTHSNDVVETVKASIKAALRGEMGRRELTVSTKDGREIPVYFTSTPMLDPGGEVVGIALEGVDITELKEREGALRSSEARYRELISRMNEGFCAIDENGYLTFVNPRLCEMLEYSEDELIGMDIRDLLDEENRQILERELEKRGRGESSRYELTWTARSGKKIPALMSASPIPAKGVYKGSYAVITDLSRIREAEELYRTIIDAASEAKEGFALVQDIDGIEAKHVYVNDYYCELTGYTRDELYQMSAFELIPDDIKDEVHDRYIRKMRGEDLPRYHEFEWMNRNGEKFTVGLSSAVAAYRGRPAFLYYFRDVTEEKRMREEIKQKSVFLESILKSMSDMVAIIDLDGRITAVNHAVEEELGFRMDEIIGLGFNEAGWFDESLRDEIGLFLGRVAEGEVIEDREITIFTEDGQPIQILFSMAPILDRSSGEVLGIIAQGTDISELKEAHEALKARAKEIEEYTDELLTQKEQLIVMTAELETAKTYLEILIDTIPSALFTVNTEKKITFWNRACEDITGYTREEVLGESCSIIKGNCCDGYCALFDDDVVKPVRGREC
ncbi:MAG: PAS domain S-box protein, partial [Candidatus Syntrophoarchaeum sp. WYZ-LMO15]